jgi:hypothetical protein
MIEREIDFEQPLPKTTPILESAADFGLASDEILDTVIAALERLPEDTKAECIDELAGALATRLLAKQRG